MDSSATTLTILLGFAALFICLGPLEAAAKIQASRSGAGFAVAAASALLLPAVLTTFALTSLLLVAHARALGRRADADAAGAAGRRRLLDRLASATVAATSAALLAAAVVALAADGYLGGGADDLGWLDKL